MATATVPKDKIAEKAYEIFKSRGEKPGKDLDDWLQAEREIARSGMRGSTVPFQSRKNRNLNNNLRFG
jgi:hypothetical protein